jgi:hypothetical protein
MRKYDEQKALAGFCCFNAVTSLATAGHRTGLGVAAGTGFASAKATSTIRTSESIIDSKIERSANTIGIMWETKSKRELNHIHVKPKLSASASATLLHVAL